MFLRKQQYLRPVALFMALLILVQVVIPLPAYALTSGPAQPEFSSFEPVGTVKMVDEFTGNLTYNLPLLEIPGPEGSGYPISLSYHSGASSEEEASWVGYGWSLNPGAVQRGKAGLPDDFKGEEVIEYNRVPHNWTVNAGMFAGAMEAFSHDLLGLNLSSSIRYNNYRGFGYVLSAGASISGGINGMTGTGSLGYSYSDGDGAFSLKVSVKQNLDEEKEKFVVNPRPNLIYHSFPKSAKKMQEEADQTAKRGAKDGKGQSSGPRISEYRKTYGAALPGRDIRPTSTTPYIGFSYNLQLSTQVNVSPFPAGLTLGLEGYYSIQMNKGENALNGYGYLYTHEANEDALMDYYLERQTSYEAHDRYLPIPFTSVDNFSATGEAIGGGFRLHNQKAGLFHPNRANGNTFILNTPVEFSFGANFGVGTDVGVGYNLLRVKEWDNPGLGFIGEGDEPYFFRFTGDKGGYMQPSNINAEAGLIPLVGGINLPSGFSTEIHTGDRVGRGSYIGYTLNSDMLVNGPLESSVGNRPLHSYTHDVDLLGASTFVDRSSVPDGIGEISIMNSGGVQQIYALPVYSRNEHELGYVLQGVNPSHVPDNYLIHQTNSKEESRYVVGREMKGAYASQYLLTELRQPDYVDRTLNGPSEDDFGGWTKFHYVQYIGTADKADGTWYKWRMPYTGLLYDRGELSSKMDDRATVAYGEKEIYYLDTIETRTHYAVFEKSERDDALEAHSDEAVASASSTAQGSAKLMKLDRIKLYRKGPGGDKLMQTVHFQYDYSAWAGCGDLPNTTGGEGKLTLRRVWFDYEGAHNARISPYEFYYQYPHSSSSGKTYPSTACSTYSYGSDLPDAYTDVDYPDRYDHLEDYGYYMDENPAYDPRDLDPWGGYQMGGENRFTEFRPWQNQKPIAPNPGTSTIGFDPAAFQLKTIKLPSGGEIHIHYEQDDYAHVQDRPAMAMVRTTPVTGTTDEFDIELGSDLGTLSTGEIDAMVNIMENRMVNQREKIYFKFLYSLFGGTAPNLSDCSVEFIDGYASVESVSRVGSKIRINLVEGTADRELPYRVCKDFVKTQRAGIIQPGVDCGLTEEPIQNGLSPLQLADQFMAYVKTHTNLISVCGDMDPDHSYFRVPVLKKLGGGLRVKRIMMYDQGLEANGEDRVLYGTEYDYLTEDGGTSGVATREPATVRDEDPLVNLLDRNMQSQLGRIVAGRDRNQSEGPIGESVLPPSSVGYARIVAKSIHTGATSPGFTVSEFYTCKDFPYDKVYPALDNKKAFDATLLSKERRVIPEVNGLLPIITFGLDHLRATQGYRFVVYDIHGHPKSFGTFAGTWDNSSVPTRMLPNDLKMISYQKMDYYGPGESLPIMHDLDDVDATGWYPGTEVDITTESREVEERYLNARLEQDLTVSLLLGVPVPVFGVGLNINYSDNSLKTFVSSKVVRYPAIQKRILSYQDGIWHSSEHLYFNPDNGEPVVTQTTDSYDGLDLQHASPSGNHNGTYRAYSIPASRPYKAMGQKAENERLRLFSNGMVSFTKSDLGSGEIVLTVNAGVGGSSTDVCSAMELLTPGSKVYVKKASPEAVDGVYHLGNANGNTIRLLPSAFYGSNLAGNNIVVNLEILESGKQNRLDEAVGGFTTYGVPGTITTTPVSPGVISLRESLYVDALNTVLGDIVSGANTSGIGMVELDAQCVFQNAHSPEAGIRLTKVTAGAGYHILVELVDWRNSAQIVRCSELITNYGGGEFAIDGKSAEIVFIADGAECVPYQLPCLVFCENAAETKSMPRVVVASAVTLADHWPYDHDVYGAPQAGANVYESGERGKWRVEGSYQYRTAIVSGAYDEAGDRNYKDAGTFTLNIFDYQNLSVNDPEEWLRGSIVTSYTPHGMAVEEKNILGIYSAAHFGYHQTVPLLTAQNTTWDQCYFESFEMLYGSNKVEEGVVISASDRTSSLAHSGKYSYELAGSSTLSLRPFTPSVQMIQDGYSLQVWVYDPDFGQNSITATLNSGLIALPLSMMWQARVGNWNLYEGKVVAGGSWGGIIAGYSVTPILKKAGGTTGPIQIDDVRYQPLAAQMNCYVYDPSTLKMICTFDDQHFGVYNQYNGEGRLVRKLIETERGMRTVQEANQHTPSQIRPQ